jgi:hypothetical protein
MVHRKLRGNEFWECPNCNAELWPYDERVEKEIQKTMRRPLAARKRSGGGRRKRRYKTRKPGEKWVPWYQR